MILAAGRGTRMRPLTDHRPKALVAVAGRALVDHALAQVRGADRVAVNAHHHADLLEAHLADHPNVRISREPVLLETGGGLRAALPLLGRPAAVLTINADMVWTGPRAIDTLRAAWDPARMDGLLLLTRIERRVEPGRWAFALDDSGRLSRDEAGWDYAGAGIVRTEGLAAVEADAFSLRELWAPMMAAGRLHGVVHPGGWMDVGRPEAVAAAERMLALAALA